MLYGYIRTDGSEEALTDQQISVESAKCSKLFTDVGISDTAVVRPELERLVAIARPGDCIVIKTLAVLSRSITVLLEDLGHLAANKIDLWVVNEQIDSRTAEGAGSLYMAQRLGQLGAATRANAQDVPNAEVGPRGRPSSINDDLWQNITAELEAGGKVASIATANGVSRAAIYRRLAR